MNPIIYGISNCDSVKKARRWLETQDIEYTFVDVRQTLPTAELLGEWIAAVGPDKLVNRRSTTWKNLPEQQRQAVIDGEVLPVLLDNPTLIKRPVLVHRGDTVVGFTPSDYDQRFNH
ncbi:MAG: Spx/MgsR family RNA polymerase-binding regulatory protein [Luminiphilus sp.]|jgi:arsenate reductase